MDTFLLITLAAFLCFSVTCDRSDRDFFRMHSFCNKIPLEKCGGSPVYSVIKYNVSDKTIELPPEYVETNGFFARVTRRTTLCTEYDKKELLPMNYISMFMKVPMPRFRLQITSEGKTPLLTRDFNHTSCWMEIIVPLPQAKAGTGMLQVKYVFTGLPMPTVPFIAMIDYIGLFKTKDNTTEVDPLKRRATATNVTVKPRMPSPPRAIPWEEFDTVDTMIKVAVICLVTALAVEMLFIICVVIR